MSETITRERTITWSAPEEVAAAVLGREPLVWMREMMEGTIPSPPFARLLDLGMESVEVGKIVFSMKAEEWMTNPVGLIHGGMAATLLDSVMTLAVVTKLSPGKMCTTLDLHVRYLRPLFPNGEKLMVEGVAVHAGAGFGTAEGRVVDARGKLIATGTASLAIIEAARMSSRA